MFTNSRVLRLLWPTVVVVFATAGALKVLGAVRAPPISNETILTSLIGDSRTTIALFGFGEIAFAGMLWFLRRSKIAPLLAGLVLSVFVGVLLAEMSRDKPRLCGCLLSSLPLQSDSASPVLLMSIIANLFLICICAAVFTVPTMRSSAKMGNDALAQPTPGVRQPIHSRTGFTVIELMVVIGIIALVSAIVVIGVGRAKSRALETRCAANLRELHNAFQIYATANRGYFPRYAHTYEEFDGPVWVVSIGDVLLGRAKWKWADLPRVEVLQCPAHPTENIPTGFTLNCFDFGQAPHFSRGAGPVIVSKIRSPSTFPWLLESSDRFGVSTPVLDDIYHEPFHVAYQPRHLPDGSKPRITFTRHGTKSNVLYLDGHVSTVGAAGLKVADFDDRAR